jgi:hypothetical protein
LSGLLPTKHTGPQIGQTRQKNDINAGVCLVKPNRPTKFDILCMVEAGKSYAEQTPHKLYIIF